MLCPLRRAGDEAIYRRRRHCAGIEAADGPLRFRDAVRVMTAPGRDESTDDGVSKAEWQAEKSTGFGGPSRWSHGNATTETATFSRLSVGSPSVSMGCRGPPADWTAAGNGKYLSVVDTVYWLHRRDGNAVCSGELRVVAARAFPPGRHEKLKPAPTAWRPRRVAGLCEPDTCVTTTGSR